MRHALRFPMARLLGLPLVLSFITSLTMPARTLATYSQDFTMAPALRKSRRIVPASMQRPSTGSRSCTMLPCHPRLHSRIT